MLRSMVPVMVADGGLRVLVVSTERKVGAMEHNDADASGSTSPNFTWASENTVPSNSWYRNLHTYTQA